jgi:hypothetical protein
MAKDQDDRDDGQKLPPQHSPFKSGQSDRPSERSDNVRNFKADLLDELREQIAVRENGRDRMISKQRAFIKSLVAAAIKGDMRATNALVSFCTRSLGEGEDEDVKKAPTADDIDIVEAFVTRERKRRRSQEADTEHTNPTKKGS